MHLWPNVTGRRHVWSRVARVDNKTGERDTRSVDRYEEVIQRLRDAGAKLEATLANLDESHSDYSRAVAGRRAECESEREAERRRHAFTVVQGGS